MKVLIFKNTTDTDLFKGLQICYPNIDGQYTNLGEITDILEKDGIKLYLINTAMGAYTADELKLIDYEQANSFKELEQAVLTQQTFVPVTEDLYDYALGVVPPIYLNNHTWQMGECFSGDLYYTFGRKDGQYYGCLCNSNFSLNNFNK